MTDFSNITYESTGVYLTAQNEVNKEIARRLKEQGLKAEGLFGGTVSLKPFKNQKSVTLEVACGNASCSLDDDIKNFGKNLAKLALMNTKGTPIAALDYIASEEMGDFVADFVESVAKVSISNRVPIIGGESAQLPDTYRERKLDAFVHIIAIGNPKGYDIAPLIKDMEDPLLVASTDGTGTKTKIVANPADLIYHGFNDIAAQGVKSVAFSLYVSGNISYADLEAIDEIAQDVANQEKIMKLPSQLIINNSYLPYEVDIAGTVIGLVDKKDIITGSKVIPGDKIIGIQVDGFMTNGCSLARKLCDKFVEHGFVSSLEEPMIELEGKSLEYELSRPHRPMVDILFGYDTVEGVLAKYKDHVKGMAHITGGGQPDNIVRMIPDNCRAVVHKGKLDVPPLMKLFKKYGTAEGVLDSTFNMGVGFTLTVSKEYALEITNYINDNFRDRMKGVSRQAALIGHVVESKKFEFI